MARADANTGAIRAAIAAAEPVVNARVAFDPDVQSLTETLGINPGQWEPNRLGLPKDCPVTPLGFDGEVYYFLDTTGQLRATDAGGFGKSWTTSLFMGRTNFLYWAWPRLDKKGAATSWRNELVQECLMGACAKLGNWSPVNHVRGRGAWRDASGRLILHLGKELLMGGRPQPCGVYDGYIYPTRPSIPKPWGAALDAHNDPALVLLPLLRKWKWARPEIDPVLMLGWIGAAFLSGALPWRPAVFVTADAGTGKSSLQTVLNGLFGDYLVQSTDATAAGISSKVGMDALPVALDEMEAKANSTKGRAVIELMRSAASGGAKLRGSDKHAAVEFTSRSSFLFSSINPPPLGAQDLSRLAILRLRKAEPGEEVVNDATLAAIAPRLPSLGQMTFRRMMEDWPSFETKWAAFREQLAAGGHDGRGQQTFGILLTCASMIVGERFDELEVPLGDDLSQWQTLLKASGLAEFEDKLPNWLQCLNHLLSVDVEAWRNGVRQTIGELVSKRYVNQIDPDESRKLLNQAGLSLHSGDLAEGGIVRGIGDWLVVPNQSPKLRDLFKDSDWVGEIGSSVWAGALRQAPAQLWRAHNLRVNGVKQRCVLISLDGLYGPKGVMGPG